MKQVRNGFFFGSILKFEGVKDNQVLTGHQILQSIR